MIVCVNDTRECAAGRQRLVNKWADGTLVTLDGSSDDYEEEEMVCNSNGNEVSGSHDDE